MAAMIWKKSENRPQGQFTKQQAFQVAKKVWMQRQAAGQNPAAMGRGRGGPGAGAGRGMPAGGRGMPAGGRGMPAGGRGRGGQAAAGRGRGGFVAPKSGAGAQRKWGDLNAEQKGTIFQTLRKNYEHLEYPADLQNPQVTNAYVMQIGKK